MRLLDDWGRHYNVVLFSNLNKGGKVYWIRRYSRGAACFAVATYSRNCQIYLYTHMGKPHTWFCIVSNKRLGLRYLLLLGCVWVGQTLVYVDK
jgi:hypothetical protein